MDNHPASVLQPRNAPYKRCPLPLQQELDAVQRILLALHVTNQPCLDIGFPSPDACRQLRDCGGYWTSVAADPKTCARLAAELTEPVECLGSQAMLPFEDKQFNVVVLSLGRLSGDYDADMALIRECHRVLKVSGYLILTVEYAKPLGLAHLLHHRRPVTGTGGRYSEAALFDLLKTGFDWLGLRTYCRFWMQMVRQWADSRTSESDQALHLAALYRTARICDCLAFFSRGYLVTAYGRRKGWRPRQTPKLADGRNLSETVLRQPR